MLASRLHGAFESFLRQDEEKELLRLSTAGSVDDGKSTLLGRLLYDSNGAYDDQIASVRKLSTNGGPIDLALLTDGLRAEREQGITIDVAYRYFSTPRRKFILADTPGHEQYTRNMATGASTAELAIILVDARKGISPQTRRHTFIASLLGIPRIVVAVNKMDLVDFREEVFDEIRAEFLAFASRLRIEDPYFIPVSALHGDNVVEKSNRTSWYGGSSLLEYLEEVDLTTARSVQDFRLPVQYVLRPDSDFRGYAGQIASGRVQVGNPIMALPGGRKTRVKSIVTFHGNLTEAVAPMSIAVCLDDEIDINRGDMLVSPSMEPFIARNFEATLVWMDEKPLRPGRLYLAKHTTQSVRAQVKRICYKVEINDLQQSPAAELRLNDVGCVTIQTNRPLFFDSYEQSRATGSFILIDHLSNATVAAGMIKYPLPEKADFERVTSAERWMRAGAQPVAIWLGDGHEIAHILERRLFDLGCAVAVVSAEGHSESSFAAVVSSLNLAGVIAICCAEGADRSHKKATAEALQPGVFMDIDPDTLLDDPVDSVEMITRALIEKGMLGS